MNTYLNSKVDPLLKVLTPLAPLEIHPTGIMNPNGNITIVTNTLILLGNVKLRTFAHYTLIVIPFGESEVNSTQWSQSYPRREGGRVG